MTKYNILLVEDDEVDIMNVERSFHKINLTNQVCITRNGVEALEALRTHVVARPLVILLDLNMPKMNGIEFLAQMRGDESIRSLPVVVLTTSNEDRDKIAAYGFNVAGYILKPVRFEDFVSCMASLGNYWSLCEHAG